ncbi:MAG: hypothetical protein PHV36_13515 [Elusimicrobiales bacterium]|nr:hypothetical protein [Elusimicrobiales bacterium]
MKNLFFPVFFFLGATASAQYEVKPGTAAPETAAVQKPPVSKYAPEILLAIKNLSALLERGAEIPQGRIDALAPELSPFNAKVRTALGKEILEDIARREKELDDRERSAAAKKTLQAFRAALQVYYGDKGAVYPKNPGLLVPDIITEVPELHLPGHERTARVTVIDSKKYDKDLGRAVEDTGGWLYFSDPGSDNYGLLVLDCSHLETGGSEFFRY